MYLQKPQLHFKMNPLSAGCQAVRLQIVLKYTSSFHFYFRNQERHVTRRVSRHVFATLLLTVKLLNQRDRPSHVQRLIVQ